MFPLMVMARIGFGLMLCRNAALLAEHMREPDRPEKNRVRATVDGKPVSSYVMENTSSRQ